MKTTILSLALLLAATSVAAQAPRGFQPPKPQPLFFKETWKPSHENVKLTQDFVLNPELVLDTYGTGEEGFGVTDEGGPAHIWTGNCADSCVLTLADRKHFVDLSGRKARIHWYTKTSGFHEIRPVLKLADGTWLIGDHVDANTYDYHESEFYLSEVRWLTLDMPAVRTHGNLSADVDLGKVDAIGFADLTPGSGHGPGGFSDVAWIEVYGTPVPR